MHPPVGLDVEHLDGVAPGVGRTLRRHAERPAGVALRFLEQRHTGVGGDRRGGAQRGRLDHHGERVDDRLHRPRQHRAGGRRAHARRRAFQLEAEDEAARAPQDDTHRGVGGRQARTDELAVDLGGAGRQHALEGVEADDVAERDAAGEVDGEQAGPGGLTVGGASGVAAHDRDAEDLTLGGEVGAQLGIRRRAAEPGIGLQPQVGLAVAGDRGGHLVERLGGHQRALGEIGRDAALGRLGMVVGEQSQARAGGLDRQRRRHVEDGLRRYSLCRGGSRRDGHARGCQQHGTTPRAFAASTRSGSSSGPSPTHGWDSDPRSNGADYGSALAHSQHGCNVGQS